MIVFNMSNTLKPMVELTNDYRKTARLAQPFVEALEQSRECFASLFLSAKHLWAVLDQYGLNQTYSDYTKWSVEGIFEYVRRTEFPACCCRLTSNFYYDESTDQARLFDHIWGAATKEEKATVKFYVIELDDAAPEKKDMLWFDKAYDVMDLSADVDAVIEIARKYFSGLGTESPIWELISDKKAVVIRER